MTEDSDNVRKNLARQPLKSSAKSCNHEDSVSSTDSFVADKVQRQIENIRILREIVSNLSEIEISNSIVDFGDNNDDASSEPIDVFNSLPKERGNPVTWSETHHGDHYYKCPIEKCDIIVSEKDFETGLAVKHMSRVHKITQRNMMNRGLEWRKLSLLEKSCENEAAPDNSSKSVEFYFFSHEKIEKFKRKIQEKKSGIVVED